MYVNSLTFATPTRNVFQIVRCRRRGLCVSSSLHFSYMDSLITGVIIVGIYCTVYRMTLNTEVANVGGVDPRRRAWYVSHECECEVPLLAWVSRRLTSSYDSSPLPPTAGTISGPPQHSAASSHHVAVCYSLDCPWYLLIKFFQIYFLLQSTTKVRLEYSILILSVYYNKVLNETTGLSTQLTYPKFLLEPSSHMLTHRHKFFCKQLADF